MLRRVLAGSSGGVSLSSDVMLASLHHNNKLRNETETSERPLYYYAIRALDRVQCSCNPTVAYDINKDKNKKITELKHLQ